MAVTIIQEPSGLMPSNNPIVYTFDSDQTAQPNFSFYVEVTIDSNLHSAHQVFPELGNVGKFDVSQIVRSLTTTPVIDSTFVQDYDTAAVDVRIKVYEKYGTPAALGAFDTSNRIRSFNGSLKYSQFIDWQSSTYNVKATNGALFTTNFPRAEKTWCRWDECFFLGLLSSRLVVGDSYRIFIELFDINGNSITSDAQSITHYQYWQFNVGPEEIVNNTAITSAHFDLCAYYQVFVEFTDGVTTNYTEFFTIWYDQECTRYTPVRLHWLNKFGSYDSYSFDLVSQSSANVTANNYQRQLGEWETGGFYSFLATAPQMQHYSKRAIEQMIVNSDWIKQEVQHWLVEELYESPRVYVEDGSRFYPVMVTNPNYVKKLRRKDGLIQELVQLDKTHEYISQLN
jgi:hypothetical protein